jgi:integrase/recombinase XerD
MAYIDEADRRSVRLVDAIANDKTIPEGTKKTMGEFNAFMQARGLAPRTTAKTLYCLATFLKAVGDKDLKSLTKEEVQAAMAIVERSAYSVRTKANIKIAVKCLYKHLAGNDEFYPEQVRWIKSTIKNEKRMLPEDILTEEDVLMMLEAAREDRDKAMIAVLFDAGIRVGELLTLRIKDVDLQSQPAHLRVDGKTGMRQIPILFSVPYLGRYLDACKKARKPTDYLWERYGKWAAANKALDRSGIVKILNTAAYKAGIQKRVNPHSFRHARATYYANRLTEQQLKQFFGWTAGSNMAATYVHLSGRDLDNGILQANGYRVNELSDPKLKARLCPKCRTANGAEMQYCGRCGSAMAIEIAMDQDRRNNLYAELTKDPTVLKAMAKVEMRMKAQEKLAAKNQKMPIGSPVN